MLTKRSKSKARTSIGILNDDCLIQVFQHLTIADRMRLERVCRRWRMLGQLSWMSFKRLDCSFETWGLSKFPTNSYHTISNKIFEKVVRLSGRYLTYVCLSLEAFRKIYETVENIRELYLFDILPHLEIFSSESELEYELCHWKNLNFDCHCNENNWQEIIQWLSFHSKKITKFGLNFCHNYYREEDLASLFSKMKNLKSFHLADCGKMNFIGNCLHHLPFETIEEICLVDVQNLDNVLLSSIIKNCRKLRKICLYRLFGGGIDSILEAFVSQAESLRNIDLRICGTILRDNENIPQFLSNVSQLRHLEKLDFINAGEFVNDNFLEIVTQNCKQLVHLNVAGKNNVSDRGIRSISRLKSLLFLDIRDIKNIKSPPLEKLKNLEVLNCSNCINIREKVICLFLIKARNLRAIDVRDCPSVTTELLYIADDVINQRNSKKTLDIYIERVKIPESFCYRKHPLLVMGIGTFEGSKYGFQNILRWSKMPQIRIKPNSTTNINFN